MHKQPLKLALLAPLVTPIGPPFLGGAQVMLHDLALGLAERGHTVTLFAATGSKIDQSVELVEVPVKPGELTPADFNDQDKADKRLIDRAFLRQGELFLQTFLKINAARPAFDLAHSHAFDWPAFALGALSSVPTVHTMHLPDVDPNIKAVLQTTYVQTGYSQAVTVSKACAATFGQSLVFDRIIYNGIDSAEIPFGAQGENFLLFAGRMAPEKGPDLAIRIAEAAGKRLVLAGGIYDQAFFNREIAPRLVANPNLNYLGPLGRKELYALMSRAEATLFPSRWEEPFGLVLAESLAAGTPVISWKHGAAPEIIEDGKTGFLVPYLEADQSEAQVEVAIQQAAQVLKQVGQIDRQKCRQSITERFSSQKMLDEYEAYYYEVIARWQTSH